MLVRALEPVTGVDVMRANRGTDVLHDLCRGPGRLCRALAIDRTYDGATLFGEAPVWLAPPERTPGRVGTSRRIGITRAASRLLRYYERGNRFLSGPRSLSPA